MEIKSSVAVLITCGNKIFLRHAQHEGYEILDVFGSFIKDGVDAAHTARKAVQDFCPESIPLKHIGTITNIIHKPSNDVELTLWVYKAELKTEEQVKKVTDGAWYEKEGALADERAKRIHKIIDRDAKNKSMDFYVEENQFGRWIDSEVIKMRDL